MSAYEEYYKDKNKRLETEKELLEEKIKALMVMVDEGAELRAKHVVELCNEINKLKQENKNFKGIKENLHKIAMHVVMAINEGEDKEKRLLMIKDEVETARKLLNGR